MKRMLTTALTVIGAVTVLVLAANTVALATTGHAILAGKTNTANKLTTLGRTTSGPALQVKTRLPGNPPFAVNGKGRVTNLNADKVDGLDSSQLATNTTVYTGSDTTTVHAAFAKWELPVSAGDYTFTYSIGIVPSTVPSTVRCNMGATGLSFGFETTYVGGSPGLAGLSASATVHIGAADTVTFYCNSTSTTFTLAEELPLQITATRITHATIKAAVPS